jgi:hypothetical protein
LLFEGRIGWRGFGCGRRQLIGTRPVQAVSHQLLKRKTLEEKNSFG